MMDHGTEEAVCSWGMCSLTKTARAGIRHNMRSKGDKLCLRGEEKRLGNSYSNHLDPRWLPLCNPGSCQVWSCFLKCCYMLPVNLFYLASCGCSLVLCSLTGTRFSLTLETLNALRHGNVLSQICLLLSPQ